MKICNKTKATTVSEKTEICTTLWQKASGLMFSEQRDLLFEEAKEKRISLHMCFVFYPIDIIYLNKEKQVVEIKENFKPFTLYVPKCNAQYVLELKKGAVQASETAITDFLVFE